MPWPCPPPTVYRRSSLPAGALGGPIAGAWASSTIAQQHGSMDSEMNPTFDTPVDVQVAAEALPMDASAAALAQEEAEWQRLSTQLAQQWQARGSLLEPTLDPTTRAAKYLLQAHKEIETAAAEPSTRIETLGVMLAAGQAACQLIARAASGRGAEDREGRATAPHGGEGARDRSRDGASDSEGGGSVHHFPVD